MKQTKLIMGMPITVEIADKKVSGNIFQKVFVYFRQIDKQFSPFKKTSEVSLVSAGKILPKDYSTPMKEVVALAEKTKVQTGGFFDVWHNGKFNPSGIVKGWAILNATDLIAKAGFANFYVEAGGDVEARGLNGKGEKWQVGIRNPFAIREIVKTLDISNLGMATSGTYFRGRHIYNPFDPQKKLDEVVSLTVIGKNILEADRFATACFAMGKEGIEFLEKTPDLEGYLINAKSIATMTRGFEKYITKE